MKMKKTILSCLLALGFLSASAQDQQPTTEYVFNPHWYVQIQPLGLQHTLGEVDFGDLNSYNVQAAIGRQFSPIFGGRLAVNAWQSKAGSNINGKDFLWDWKYVAPALDLTINLSNALCGYNPNRVFNFGLFLGGGVIFEQLAAEEGNGGICLDQKLLQSVSIAGLCVGYQFRQVFLIHNGDLSFLHYLSVCSTIFWPQSKRELKPAPYCHILFFTYPFESRYIL